MRRGVGCGCGGGGDGDGGGGGEEEVGRTDGEEKGTSAEDGGGCVNILVEDEYDGLDDNRTR